MKKVLIGLGVVVVVVVGAVVYLVGNLDSLIKQAVEDVGSEATGAKVSLAGVELSLTDGRGALKGLRVGNPSGFKTDYAFDLGGISVTLDTATVNSDPVVIKEIAIDGPKLIYELAGSGSNIDAIQKNVDAYAKQFAGGGSDSGSGGEGPKLVIEDLYIRGGQVDVSAGFLEGQSLGTALPDIHIEDIGKDEGGASAGEVASEIISSLTDGIGGAVSGLDLEGMMQGVTDAASGIAEGAAGQAEGMADEAGKAVEGAAEGIGDSINSLIGN